MDVNRTARLTMAVALVLVAACGGDDDAPDATADTSVPTSSSTVTSVPGSSSVPVSSSSLVVTTTTGPDVAPVTTEAPPAGGTAPATAAPPPPTAAPTAAPTTAPDADVDESALALVEAGLYSIPNADVQCGSGAPDGALSMVYAFPADGGDLYIVCAETDAPAGGDVLRISTPSGNRVTDVRLDPSGDLGTAEIGRSATNVVATGADGRVRVLGTVFGEGSRDQYQIPLFLGHNREAGGWRIEFNGTAVAVDVRRPCAAGGPGSQSDPTAFDPRIRFQRTGPVEFAHCRGFPDVSGLLVRDAVPVVRDHFDRQGISVDIRLFDPECGPLDDTSSTAVVTGSSIAVGTVEPIQINDRSALSNLDVDLECPTPPDLTGEDFDVAKALLDDLVADSDHFTWTADASCVSGTTVAEQEPAGGAPTVSVVIARCE